MYRKRLEDLIACSIKTITIVIRILLTQNIEWSKTSVEQFQRQYNCFSRARDFNYAQCVRYEKRSGYKCFSIRMYEYEWLIRNFKDIAEHVILVRHSSTLNLYNTHKPLERCFLELRLPENWWYKHWCSPEELFGPLKLKIFIRLRGLYLSPISLY